MPKQCNQQNNDIPMRTNSIIATLILPYVYGYVTHNMELIFNKMPLFSYQNIIDVKYSKTFIFDKLLFVNLNVPPL